MVKSSSDAQDKEPARMGKWTIEEEAFAMKLIEEFEAARLPDVHPNCTLRKFLSEKLRCTAMRISKKFGGRCAGKRPYKSYQAKAESTSVTDLEELQRLENDFLHSVNFFKAEINEDGSEQLPSSSALNEIVFPSTISNSKKVPFPQQFSDHPAVRRKTIFNPFIHPFPDEIGYSESQSYFSSSETYIKEENNSSSHRDVLKSSAEVFYQQQYKDDDNGNDDGNGNKNKSNNAAFDDTSWLDIDMVYTNGRIQYKGEDDDGDEDDEEEEDGVDDGVEDV